MKKILTLILVLAAVLSVSGIALAADVNLDIAYGSIVIDATGYTQGSNSGSADNYIITGTATTANTITVNGGNPTITFSGLNITRNNDNSSVTPVLNINSNATIKLDGSNTIDSSGATKNDGNTRHDVVKIDNDAVMTLETLEGSGSFTVKGTTNQKLVTGQGLLKLNSGSFTASGGSSGVAVDSAVEINGGVFDVSYTGNNNAKGVDNSSFKLTGGEVYVTAEKFGIQTENFEMSGGSISKITVDSGKPTIFATTVSITGGNVNGYFTAPAIGNYKLTKLHVVEDNGEYKKAEPVTITTSSGTWNAVTDGNGVITTYLADGESVTGGQKVADGVWLVGGNCTCETADLSFADTVTEKDVYSNETVVDITVRGECKMPVHKAVTVNVKIDSVTLEGSDTPVEKADTYATYADGKLTLKPADNKDNYTVKLSAKRSESETPVEHEIKAWASNTVSRKFNIANGPITVVGVEDNVTYKQGTDEYTVSKDTQVTITGEAAANSENLIKVDNCDPSIILQNVTVTPATGSKSPILISGDSHAKIYISGTNKLVEHISGKALSRDICGIELSSTDANNPAKVTIDCIEGSDCTDKSCPHKLYVYADLGAGIGARHNASSFFEVNIEGGHIIAHPGNYGTGIGSGWNSTDQIIVDQFTVNIRDGFVEADGLDSFALIGYGRNRSAAGVNINISGGAVDAKSTASGEAKDCCAISGETITISGTDTEVKTDGSISAKTILVSGTAKLDVNEKIVPSGDKLKFPAAVSGTVIVEASASYEASVEKNNNTVTVPVGKMEDVVIGNDGTITLPAGSVVETPDGVVITLPNGGTIGADGTVTPNGDAVTTITPPEGEKVTVKPDGTVEIPAGSEIKTEDGATVTIPKETGTVTIPADKLDEVAVDEDGNVTLPAGSTVTKDDETITLPEGGTIASDGTITSNDDVTITDAEGNETTITPTEGEKVTVKPDGTVEVPAGSTVTKDGETITLPNGGTIGADGTVTSDGAVITEKADGTVEITKGEDTTTITPPDDKAVVVNADGTVEVPVGSTVTKPDCTKITLPNGGTIGADGTITPNPHKIIKVTPDNGVFTGENDLAFTSDAEYDDFLRVEVDEVEVAKTNYIKEPGSTKVTLKAAYLKTLTVGEHTLEIVSETGTAATKFTIAQGAGVPVYTGGSSYSGPSIWYIGGNSFGTSTTQMPTSVEIDNVPVPFSMEGSKIVVSCINPGARWATVKWNSTSATINFNPDANVVCAQVVIPKTGDMPIWAEIAEFLGF